MTIQEIINYSRKKLITSSTSPELDSEVLLSHVLKKPKSYLFVHMHKCVPRARQQKFFSLLAKRQKGWPVAYLIGRKEFYGLDFFVNKNVLIPRPETETLVDLVLERLKIENPKFKIENSKLKIENSKLKILDIGTGSGCIIISLAKTLCANSHEYADTYEYFASDISKTAISVAKKNAKIHRAKITFKQGGLLLPWKNKSFDIIVANLPYGWKAWKNNTSAETVGLKFEPTEALFTTKKGLALYEQLLKQVSSLSPAPRSLFLEFDPRQTKQMKKLAKKLLPMYLLEIKKDLSKKNRFAYLHRKNSR